MSVFVTSFWACKTNYFLSIMQVDIERVHGYNPVKENAYTKIYYCQYNKNLFRCFSGSFLRDDHCTMGADGKVHIH